MKSNPKTTANHLPPYSPAAAPDKLSKRDVKKSYVAPGIARKINFTKSFLHRIIKLKSPELNFHQAGTIYNHQRQKNIMPSKISLPAILLLFFMHQTASAEDAGITKNFSVCMDKSGGVTAEILDCIGAETKRQDTRLNKAYKEVMSQLPSARKKQLQDAQRAWIKYRDANCDFYADPDGGTMATVSSNDCLMSATASRAKELESFK